MIIAHNTFTSLRPKQWWLRPFAWMARCQSLDYRTLHQQYGVEGFDVRLWYMPDHSVEFRHGMFRYDSEGLMPFLAYCETHRLAIRLMLECRSKRMLREASLRGYEKRFASDCALWQRLYPHIKFYGGRNVYTWKKLALFTPTSLVAGDDSASSPFNPIEFEYHASADGRKWYRKLNDLWPWLWTRIRSRSHNVHTIKPAESHKNDWTEAQYVMLLDFCQMWSRCARSEE